MVGLYIFFVIVNLLIFPGLIHLIVFDASHCVGLQLLFCTISLFVSRRTPTTEYVNNGILCSKCLKFIASVRQHITQ